MSRYRTRFRVRLKENGELKNERVLVNCTEEDLFFYTLLTEAFECGTMSAAMSYAAEMYFFFNGYTWIDTKKSEEVENGR